MKNCPHTYDVFLEIHHNHRTPQHSPVAFQKSQFSDEHVQQQSGVRGYVVTSLIDKLYKRTHAHTHTHEHTWDRKERGQKVDEKKKKQNKTAEQFQRYLKSRII